MTRINLVPPEELYDQHLFAEFREIKMVPKSLARSLKAEHERQHKAKKVSWICPPALPWAEPVKFALWKRIPKEFTLNTGHVSFFYDKGEYLRRRYAVLRLELARRGFNFDKDSQLDPDGVFASLDHNFNNDYVPTPEALAIIRARVWEKLKMKPDWYRYCGKAGWLT